MTPVRPRFSSFETFWPYYLGEHVRPATRSFHVFGTWVSLALLAWGLGPGPRWVALVSPVASVGIAWTCHAVVEGRRPPTFAYPLLSLRADLRMAWLAATGRLDAEVRRLGLT